MHRCAKRSFATAARSTGFNPKTTSQVWLGDSGAYPIMGIIAFASAMAIAVSAHKMQHPDTKFNKNYRKSLFRGGVKDE